MVGKDILGASILNPLDGESAEKRCWDSLLGAMEDVEATEPTEALRNPNETESRFDFRGVGTVAVGAVT